MKNKNEKSFKVVADTLSVQELEKALSEGQDLVIVSSPSDYFEVSATQTAIMLMQRYPKRRILVTSRSNSAILEKTLEKAKSGADLIATYTYAEELSIRKGAV